MRQRVVSRDEWTTARVARLAQEKGLTRLRDAISRQRRQLPWVRIDKDYVFEGSTMAWVRHHDKYDVRSAFGLVDSKPG